MAATATGDRETLKSLSVLCGGKQEPASMNTALIAAVEEKVSYHRDVIAAFFAKNSQTIIDAMAASLACPRRGRLSRWAMAARAATAPVAAVEFQHPVTAGRPALTAIDLSADRTMLTAVGNDVGFDHVFVRQIIAQGRSDDALIGLSTSGNSKNLVNAFIKAKEMGLTTIGLAGMSGGAMATIGLDHCLIVEADSIHRIQECHVTIYHILWDLVHSLLADDRGARMKEGG